MGRDRQLPGMWPTLFPVPVMVACIGALGVPYFQRVCGYDFPTVYHAMMPGGLQDMLVFGEKAGAKMCALSLIHAPRVLVIVVALPFPLKGVWQADLSNPPGQPPGDIPLSQILVMAGCALVGWQGAKRIGLLGVAVLGPLLLSAAASLSGGLHCGPSAEAIWAAQFFIGMSIGSNYAGISLQEV